MTRFGPFELLEQLGQGSMGVVHLARTENESGFPRVVVVKQLLTELVGDEDFIRRFRHEADAARSIRSRHVARVLGYGRVATAHYIVMEFVPGVAMSRVIQEARRKGELLPGPVALNLACGALRGLAALHAAEDAEGRRIGLVHRDIAPKNILVGEDGEARLIDLGIASSRLQEWRTMTGVMMGTPGYLSPEQARGERVGSASDIYSMAASLYELLTLEPLVPRGPLALMLEATADATPRSLGEFRSDLNPRVEGILRRALSKSPEARPSASEFLHAIEPFAGQADDVPSLVGQESFDQAFSGTWRALSDETSVGWSEASTDGGNSEELTQSEAAHRRSDIVPRIPIPIIDPVSPILPAPLRKVGLWNSLQALPKGTKVALVIAFLCVGLFSAALVGIGLVVGMGLGQTQVSEVRPTSPSPPTASPQPAASSPQVQPATDEARPPDNGQAMADKSPQQTQPRKSPPKRPEIDRSSKLVAPRPAATTVLPETPPKPPTETPLDGRARAAELLARARKLPDSPAREDMLGDLMLMTAHPDATTLDRLERDLQLLEK